jgi:hypothetical protein
VCVVSFLREVLPVATRARGSGEERDYRGKGALTHLPNFPEFDAGAVGAATVPLRPHSPLAGSFQLLERA